MKYSLVVFYAFLILILSVRIFTFYSSQKTYTEGEGVSFETKILSLPKTYTYYQTVFVNLDKTTKVLLKTDLDKNLNYGDYVKVSGTLNRSLLRGHTPIFTLNNPEISLDSRENNPFLSATYFIRQKIIQNFNSSLDPVSSSLLLGIVFGIKDNMPKDFLQKIQTTGVMHVVAASGMNITMAAGFFFYFFAGILKRQIAIFLAISGVLFYTSIAGFEPSIIRAAIMGILVFSAQILGRQQFSLNTLLITGAFMLFLWPEFLFDIGFALSFSATAGILYIPPLLKKLENSLTEVFITTTSAQIATLPILIGTFGVFSPLSILVNGLVLWTVPLLMVLGALAAFFSFVFTPISIFFLYLCLPFLYFFENTVSIFALLIPVLTFESLPWQFSATYYLFLASVVLFFYKRHEKVFAS